MLQWYLVRWFCLFSPWTKCFIKVRKPFHEVLNRQLWVLTWSHLFMSEDMQLIVDHNASKTAVNTALTYQQWVYMSRFGSKGTEIVDLYRKLVQFCDDDTWAEWSIWHSCTREEIPSVYLKEQEIGYLQFLWHETVYRNVMQLQLQPRFSSKNDDLLERTHEKLLRLLTYTEHTK